MLAIVEQVQELNSNVLTIYGKLSRHLVSTYVRYGNINVKGALHLGEMVDFFAKLLNNQ